MLLHMEENPLKLIKSIIQSTMSKDRWINLIILPSEHENANINFDQIICKKLQLKNKN